MGVDHGDHLLTSPGRSCVACNDCVYCHALSRQFRCSVLAVMYVSVCIRTHTYIFPLFNAYRSSLSVKSVTGAVCMIFALLKSVTGSVARDCPL